MKILLVTNHLDGTDGWSRYSLDLARELKRRGIVVFCAVHQKSDSGIEESVCLNDPVKYLYDRAESKSAALQLQSIVNDFKPDVIHFIVEPYQLLLPFLDLPANIHVIATIHGTYSYMPALFRNPLTKFKTIWGYLRSTKRIDRFISVSSYTKEKLGRHPVAKLAGVVKRTVVIENAIGIDSIRTGDRSSTDGNRHVLFVGAIKPRKGIHNLIEAFKIYSRKYPGNVVLDIVGSGDASRIDSAPNIKIRGRVSDDELDKLYGSAGVFVLLAVPDRHAFEGFGLVYLEANARGVPTIGSKDSGARDAIVHGKTGFLVDNPNDPDECAEYLHKILDKEAIKPSDCMEWAKQHDIRLAADKIIRLYQGP